MAHIPIPDCAEIGILFSHTVEGQDCEMTFGVKDTSGAIFADVPTFVGNVWTAVTARFPAAAAVYTSFFGVVFEDKRTVPYGGATFTFTPVVGTGFGPVGSLPTDNALAVKKVTAGYGRSNRGRVYWPVWEVAMLSSADHVSTTARSAIVAALTDFQGDIQTSSSPAKLSVLSTVTNKVPRSSGVAAEILSWSVFDTVIDSQRRRLVGRGR